MQDNFCEEDEASAYDSLFRTDIGGLSLLSGGDELKKLTMAVCEKDDVYTKRLADYITNHKREGFAVFCFSKEEEYLKAEQKENFDILLFGEGFFQKSEAYEKKEHVVYLSEGSVPKEQEHIPVLFKYQSADNLLRGLHYCTGSALVGGEEKKVLLGKKEVIAVYSPEHHRMQTPFALAAAEELSGRKKVLYLNFSVCRGFCKSTGIEKGMDMGDLFYLIREGEKEFLMKFRSSIYTIGSFSVIPPPENPEHYMEWTKEEMGRFLTCLLEQTEYEVLILDLGCIIPGFFQILDWSSRIWLLKENRTRGDLGIEELKELFRKRNTGLNERAKEVFLPGGQPWREDGMYRVEEFYMGEMGRCVRRLLGEEREFGNRADTRACPGRDGFERGE